MTCKLYSSAQIRELENAAAQKLGGSYVLMQRAAAACWRELQQRWPQEVIHIVCGSGNNGGDGYEIATLARAAGRDVRVWQVGAAPRQGDGALAVENFQRQGGVAQAFHEHALDDARLAVDALFGIGLSRDVEGDGRQAIAALNQVPQVLAVDVPSGLDGDTGAIRGIAVRATVTVTFIGQKPGLLTGQGPDVAGDIVFAPLDVSAECHAQQAARAVLPSADFLRHALPPRARTAHKGEHGHVLVIGGDHGMMGAALMAGQAALRGGAGWVSVATRPEHAVALCAVQPELMVRGIAQVADLLPLLAKADVMAIGPGLGQSGWAQALMDTVLESGKPLVVDADALNLIAQEPLRRENWVLTPHPGEAARLLKSTTASIQQNRLNAVRELQARYGGVVALKGAGTLVAGSGPVWLCPYGNPGMGVGGMGDVLTGLIAALVAQGLSLQQAAEVGVCVHATAGDLAAQEGERGLLPTDLLVEIRRMVNP